jgi:Cellulase (glycosyl hydrolase family 5)
MSASRRRFLLPILSAICVALGVGTGAARGAAPATTGAGAVTVSGSHLLKDGAPWIPRGVQIVGLVAPDNALSGKYVPAHAHFGAQELQAAVAEHADVIRFQVSQFGMDPQDSLYSPAYVQEVQQGIEMARGMGLDAIVSLQAEGPAGKNGRCALPDAGALRAWQQLAPMFASDPGVMFELYNEPAIAPTPAGWQTWLNGGTIYAPSGLGCAAVGMQTLIDTIRQSAPSNVIVVPGLKGEQTLAGMPVLSDPSNPTDPQFAYGVHYPSLSLGSLKWDHQFGNLSAKVPVIVTEWDQNSWHDCVDNAPERAALLIAYLASKGVGIVGFAFDLPGTIVVDYSYAPTSYSTFACGHAADGPGELLFDSFAGLARSGSQGDLPAAWIVRAGMLQRLSIKHAALVRQLFDNPRTFVTGASSASLATLGVPAAVPTASFTDENALAKAVNHSRLRAGTTAVIYDAQQSQRTPRRQRRHPALFFHRAAESAHAHGLLLIASPEAGIANPDARPVGAAQAYGGFIRRQIATATARYADVYEVNGRGARTSPTDYPWFAQLSMAQAAAAHPSTELLADLSNGVQHAGIASGLLASMGLSAQPRLSGFGLVNAPAGAAPGSVAKPTMQFLRTVLAQ